MGIVSRKEFAQLCGDDVPLINVNIQRKKVVVCEDNKKLLDTNNPINAAFIKMRSDFNALKKATKIQAKKEIGKKPNKREIDDPEFDDSDEQPEPLSIEMLNAIDSGKLKGSVGEPTARELMYKKLKGDAEWAETRAEREKLLLMKAHGNLLPSDLACDIYKVHARAIFDNFIMGVENMAVTFVSKVGGDIATQNAFMQEARLILSQCVKNAGSQAAQEFEILITNFSESRGVGEKKK